MKTLKGLSKLKFIDKYLLVPYIILCVFGIIMVYSSSSYQLSQNDLPIASKALKQMASFLLSIVAIVFIYRLNLAVLKKKRVLQLVLFLTVCILIAVSFVGQEVGGAKRWIDLGLFLFQPSELVPLVLVLYLSKKFASQPPKRHFSFQEYKYIFYVCGVFITLVVIQPNVAGAAMLVLLILVYVLASGISPWLSLLTLGGFYLIKELGTLILLSFPTKWLPEKFSYLVSRFEIMKNPFIDGSGIGFQTTNAYYAMYNGGFWGLGLGKSIQKKGFLPAADTDFVFAICMEELGLIVAMFLLFLVFFMIGRMYLLAIRSRNSYYFYMYLGCGTIFLLQVFVNIGSLLGYIPMTGVTFPFISYGGSSMLILSAVLGIVLNVRGTELRQLYAEEGGGEHARKNQQR